MTLKTLRVSPKQRKIRMGSQQIRASGRAMLALIDPSNG